MAWTDEQLRNASIIYQVGQSMGMGSRDIQIALITAMVESNLVNVHYGDSDSLGLFQQRPSQGWGTAEQVTNPQYAAGKFFSALRGLGDTRYQMGMGAAAQAVQRSAYPDRYAERIGAMRQLWPSVQQGSGDQPLSLEGNPYGAPDPTTGEIPMSQPVSLSSTLGTETPIPSASTMLGAWGMDAPQPVDPLTSGITTLISPSTNESVIQPMSQTMGGFEAGVDGWRKAVLQAARNAVGTPYVWGGSNLNSGVDCSGLVMAAFASAGIDLPRVSYQQANLGHRVGEKGLQPGDLVAWDNSSRNSGADHISIYLGNGYIIEAPRPGLSVRIRQLGPGLEGGWGVHLGF